VARLRALNRSACSTPSPTPVPFRRRRAGRGGNGQRRFIASVPHAGRRKFSAQRTRPENEPSLIADDVLAVLRGWRGEGKSSTRSSSIRPPSLRTRLVGAAFQVQRDFDRLVSLALEVAARREHPAFRSTTPRCASPTSSGPRAPAENGGSSGRSTLPCALRFSSRPRRKDRVAGGEVGTRSPFASH